jgi:hypothetical protein
MADNNSAIKAILVAVLIALIAGGSAPWWWGRLFPPPQLNPPNGSEANQNSASPPPQAKGIGACGSGDSPNTEFHDAPASNGSWDWNCNGQIEREWGPCENLTRQQCEPHTNATGAPPGFCSNLRGEGGCPPKIGECGKQGYLYLCFYNVEDGRCHAGGYETAQTMRCR